MAELIELDDLSWPGHPSRGRGGDADDVTIMEARQDGTLEWHACINDAEADYSFDDYALMRLSSTGQWAVLNTSGCSCPDPKEEWGVVVLGTAEEVCDWVIGFACGSTYGMGLRQSAEFLEWVDLIRNFP